MTSFSFWDKHDKSRYIVCDFDSIRGTKTMDLIMYQTTQNNNGNRK